MANKVPQQFINSKVEFRHAPAWLRRIAKDRGCSPTFYAMSAGSGNYIQCYFWNSRRVEFYEGGLPTR